MVDQRKTFIDKCIKKPNGQVAIGQFPNLPLAVWLVATVTYKLVDHGWVHHASQLVAMAAIIVWSLLEIFQGVNYFRRGLGLVVFVLLIVWVISG